MDGPEVSHLAAPPSPLNARNKVLGGPSLLIVVALVEVGAPDLVEDISSRVAPKVENELAEVIASSSVKLQPSL